MTKEQIAYEIGLLLDACDARCRHTCNRAIREHIVDLVNDDEDMVYLLRFVLELAVERPGDVKSTLVAFQELTSKYVRQ